MTESNYLAVFDERCETPFMNHMAFHEDLKFFKSYMDFFNICGVVFDKWGKIVLVKGA